jgi:3-oxoacyl-[acyl-carrier protein] reductase
MLRDKVALITGSSRGIGRDMVELFAFQGATVYMNLRREETNLDKKYFDKLNANSDGNIIPIYFDVCDRPAVKAGFNQIFKEQGKLDILVNNAGILKDALIGMSDEGLLKSSFETNFFGAFYCSQLGCKLMARGDGGSIINISSIVGVNGNAGQTVYSSTKAALIGFTKSLAKEMGDSKIRVNAIAPGFIKTDMIKTVPNEQYEKIMSGLSLNRIGNPRDISNCALFLASDLSEYITSQIIGVDGGMII